MNTARPLQPGEHAVGVTVGGGMVDFGAPVPLPNVVLEGRHGVAALADRPLDVGYGLNATALAFGLVQVHVGGAWLVARQHGAVPALSVADRVWFATNVLGLPSRPDPALEAWGADQVEVTASWLVRGQLPYVAVAEYVDFGNPKLTLTPALGAVWDFRRPDRGLTLQTELRWYGLGVRDDVATVDWIPGRTGILGFDVGLSGKFGGER